MTLRRYRAWKAGRTDPRLTGLESPADGFGMSPAELVAELLPGKKQTPKGKPKKK